MKEQNMFRYLIQLTKPGIIFGNLITVSGGFFLASHYNINLNLFIEVLIGISLVIAGGCTYNNYIDIDIDSIMTRTKTRVLVTKQVAPKVALIWATLLSILGLLDLYYFTNTITLIAAVIGLFVYVVIYSLWLKRSSEYGTLVGSISGSIPPIVGYLAVSNHIDLGAVILFLMLSFWQMPHSYAIAIRRIDDYKMANIPVVPLKRGILHTQKQMLWYVVLFNITCISLTLAHYTGYIFMIASIVLGGKWLYLASHGFTTKEVNAWAGKMFGLSILIITILSMLMAIDFYA